MHLSFCQAEFYSILIVFPLALCSRCALAKAFINSFMTMHMNVAVLCSRGCVPYCLYITLTHSGPVVFAERREAQQSEY